MHTGSCAKCALIPQQPNEKYKFIENSMHTPRKAKKIFFAGVPRPRGGKTSLGRNHFVYTFIVLATDN